MRKFKFLALAAAVALSLASFGAAMALFTDSVQTDTEFTAGTFCLESERNDGDPVPGPMFYVTPSQGATPGGQLGTFPTGLWAPGDSHQRTLTLRNPSSCSSMDAWVESVEASLQAGSDPALADELWVELFTPQLGTPVKVAEGYLSQFLAGAVPVRYPDGSRIPVYLNSNRHMKFKVSFDLDAGNALQGNTLVVNFTVHGVQKNNNP